MQSLANKISIIMHHITLISGALSTWSMRAWLCLKIANLDFKEVILPLDTEDYLIELKQYSDTALVPVLIHDQLRIHDSLAIAEYINELSPQTIYPKSAEQRAITRSLCAELHSGFVNIRTDLSFQLEPIIPAQLSEPVNKEICRLSTIWNQAQGEFYFDTPSIVDAFYAVMAYRLKSYHINLTETAGRYQKQLIEWPLFQQSLENMNNTSNQKLNSQSG